MASQVLTGYANVAALEAALSHRFSTADRIRYGGTVGAALEAPITAEARALLADPSRFVRAERRAKLILTGA